MDLLEEDRSLRATYVLLNKKRPTLRTICDRIFCGSLGGG